MKDEEEVSSFSINLLICSFINKFSNLKILLIVYRMSYSGFQENYNNPFSKVGQGLSDAEYSASNG